jgi:transposase-like protein
MPELTPIQSQVLAGLLAGKSVAAVARENGIHRSTIYQWRHQQPYFTLALDQVRSRHQTAMFDLVQDLAEQALETVSELLTSEDVNLRLRAAQMILRVAHPGHLSKDTRSAMQFETFADHSLARVATLPLANEPEPAGFDTIRQNPTLESQPSRNSRCACGSGLKYKRCCGSVVGIRPASPFGAATIMERT